MIILLKWNFQLNFKYLFNNLAKKDKVLIFLLIPTILYLAFIIIDNTYEPKSTHTDNRDNRDKINKIKNQINQLSKESKISQLKLIKHIENISLNTDIKILNLRISNKLFDIQTIGSFKSSINFIYNLEKDMNLIDLTLTKDNNKSIIMNCSFKLFKSTLNKQIQTIDNLANPFLGIKEYSANKPRRLNAIINKNVFIDDKWYTKNDMVGKYKLTVITSHYIVLEYRNTTLKMELLKDDI